MSRTPRLTNKVLDGLATAVGAWLAGDLDDFEDDEIENVRDADAWLDAVRAARAQD
jgi:hypothetical protein